MKHTYKIEGMHCGSCVAKIKKALENQKEIYNAEVILEDKQVHIKMAKHIPTAQLQAVVSSVGDYTLNEIYEENFQVAEENTHTYKPLILIVSFILGVSILVQYPFKTWDFMLWMRHFMAGFFIVFSFFKFLNINGFASSYMMYDIVAARWKSWGFIYPFVELSLGILYIIHIIPFATNVATIIVLGISSIGVIQSNLNKKKIRCACLGDVFNLPMSTVTIVEDIGMLLMAVAMLWFSV